MSTRTAYILIVVPILVGILVVCAIVYASWSAYRFDRMYGRAREIEPEVDHEYLGRLRNDARLAENIERPGMAFARAASVIGPMVAAAALTALTLSRFFQD